MFSSLSVPALALLISVPGLPGLHLPGFGMKAHKAAAADSIPMPWKPASLLALENELVLGAVAPILARAGGHIVMTGDTRRYRVQVDPDSGEVSIAQELGEVQLSPGARQNLSAYNGELLRATFRQQWQEKSRQSINSLGANTAGTGATTTGLSFQLPGLLPRQVQNLLGPGSPSLNVAGSENIRLSGESNWTNQQTGQLGQKRSLFPSLDMQQDLDIRLEGQLSDRIRVNLLQNSLNTIPLANRIAINYKGDEDDLIQALDLGNTNLSLPGTQYVSYSGRNEGLFGVKAATRLGPVDFTMLASKQEGRSERASYAGGAARQVWAIYAHEYVRGVYFFLYDPNGGEVFDIPDASIQLYRDDGNYNVSDITVRGRAFLDPRASDTLSLRGNFRQLLQGPDQDYEIMHDIYGPHYKVIKMRQALNYDQRLAATYTAVQLNGAGNPIGQVRIGGDTLFVNESGTQVGELSMKLIRAPLAELSRDPQGNFIDTLLTPVRHLELKSFYQLPGQRIDPLSFQMEIKRGDDEPPKTSVSASTGESVPYVEVLGLDNVDESSGRGVRGHDGKVDGTSNSDPSFGQTRVFVDFESGTLHFLEPRPFAPRLDSGFGFEDAISNYINRRVKLDGSLPRQNEPNPAIYDRYNPERRDADYRIVVDFTAQKVAGEIPLGRGNILEGSEVVTVNGRTWTRDVDYTVDYDLGRISLKRQLGPADNLSIDYSYAPLFQQAGRTLIGSAFRYDGRDRSLGGAFMYESRGAQDIRPRLGEEPARSLIGDVNGEWRFKPSWMTRLADRLPGVRTTAPSEFNAQAEVGASFPNPNTRNEVFIDDMEGVRDAVSVSMGQERWRWSSVPSRMVGASAVPLNDVPRVHNAEAHWYSPFAVVKERDLKPSLSDGEGAQNNRQVLAISVPRIPRSSDPSFVAGDPIPGDSLWVGLTYPLDASGLDLSKSQFIELWVNDFNDYHTGIPIPRVRGHHLKLHIDLGAVSEDQQRSPDVPPNNQLDSEDKGPLRDNQLVVTDSNNEDTGYDGLLDDKGERDSVRTPRDLTTATPIDPQGDDFDKPVDGLEEIDTRRFRKTNGVEGSKVIYPYPDTEDFNLNNAIDTKENYFEYTIDLGDAAQPYLVTDVQRDYSGRFAIPADNGWRRYRIPIADQRREQFGTPDLALARQVRVSIEGIRTPDDTIATAKLIRPLLMLGSLEIVGSRWRSVDLSAAALDSGSTVTLNSVNTIDNAEIYKPPFDPGETRNGNQTVTRREQSLSLEFTRLKPGMTVEAFKVGSLEEDYTRYLKLGFYAASFGVTDYDAKTDTSLYYFVRFTSDEVGLNYYEYRARLPQSSHDGSVFWKKITLPLTDLSNLKLNVPVGTTIDTLVAPGANPGERLSVIGRPSFTRLRRISIGVENGSGREFSAGQLWFNEMRATDVEKTAGRAQRLLVNGRLANVLTYSASYTGRDANFLSVGEARGAGSSNDQFSLSTSLDVHRFFEGTGIILPVTYGYSQGVVRPRFSAGDDVVRTGVYASASESRADNQNWSAAYSRSWSERSNPLLRFTVGGLTAGISQTVTHTRSASTVDTSTSANSYLNYRQSFRKLLSIPIPLLNKVRIFPLPEAVTWSYTSATRESRSYDRLRDSTASLALRNKNRGRAANLSFGVDLRPIDLLTYHVDGLRNLTLDDALSEHISGVNVGRVTNLRQNTSANYSLNRGQWLRPSFSWGTFFFQDNSLQLSSDLSVRQLSSGQTYTVRWELPLENLSGNRGAARDTTHRGFPLRQWVARLGNVSADAAFNRSSAYSRIIGSPDFLYLFGFSDDPGLTGDTPRAAAAFGNQVGRNHDWRTTGRTRLNLGLGSHVNTQVEFSSRVGESNGVEQRNDASRFPDLTFEYGRLPNAIRLDRFLVNPQLRTSYNRNRQTLFQNSAVNPTSISTASQWQPLLSLRGALKNGANLELGVERRNTQRENFQLGHSVQTDRQTTVNLSLNRSYSQGQKATVLGKTTTVRSQVNMGVSANYEKRSGETRILDQSRTRSGVRNPTSEDRLSVQGNGSYGFSTNVTGTATLGFQQNRDLQRDINRRSIRVELRGSFTF